MMVHVYVAMAMMLSDSFRSVIDPAVKGMLSHNNYSKENNRQK